MRDDEVIILKHDTLIGLQKIVNDLLIMGNYRVVSIWIDSDSFSKYIAVIARI